MFKSLDYSLGTVHVVGIFIYLTISKFKQVLRSRKGLDYNTGLFSVLIIDGNGLFIWFTDKSVWSYMYYTTMYMYCNSKFFGIEVKVQL